MCSHRLYSLGLTASHFAFCVSSVTCCHHPGMHPVSWSYNSPQGKHSPGVHLTRDLAVRPQLQQNLLSERHENGRAHQNPQGSPQTAATCPGNALGRRCAPLLHGSLRIWWVSFGNMVAFAHKQASLTSARYRRQITWCTH